MYLSLHPRVTAAEGISFLVADVLHVFLVQNQRNMFVCLDNSTGKIFYFFLKEAELGNDRKISARSDIDVETLHTSKQVDKMNGVTPRHDKMKRGERVEREEKSVSLAVTDIQTQQLLLEVGVSDNDI
jgi:hypothetical protein